MSGSRVIIELDWDAFYCSVEEHFNPELRRVAFAVRQKSIVCTCNYVARALGVRKLELLADALRKVPDLVVVNGEDLTKYRDASKELWHFTRELVWGGKVERLGLDELFLDVTAMVDFNLPRLADDSGPFFFSLSQTDPSAGFFCPRSTIAGVYATGTEPLLTEPRLVLGSHLCNYIRSRIFEQKQYTSSGGISVNKELAKMAGAQHKPNQQTVLLPEYAQDFLDGLDIGKIPGIGHRYKSVILESLQCEDPTVLAVRHRADANRLVALFGETLGLRLWDLLHGNDNSDVQPTPDVPTQISIEDTFRSLKGLGRVRDVLLRLTGSLYERIRVDLIDSDGNWMGYPHNIRLTLRHKSADYHNRISKTDAVPSIIYSTRSTSQIVETLLDRGFLPLLHKLISTPDFELVLLNVAVVNIEKAPPPSTNITAFFAKRAVIGFETTAKRAKVADSDSSEYESDEQDGERCHVCARNIMPFAIEAHLRFHELSLMEN